MQITITVPNDKVQQVADGICSLYPIPVDEAGEPTHTRRAWAVQQVRGFLIRSVRIAEEMAIRRQTHTTEDVAIEALTDTPGIEAQETT